MFERIKQFVKNVTAKAAARARQRQEKIEEFQRGDPVASQTEWDPAVGGGTNFCTRRLVQASVHRLEFRPTVTARVFPLIFFFCGVVVLVIAGYQFATGGFENPMLAVFVPLFGCVFAGAGGLLYWLMTRQIAFDRTLRCFWKGKMPMSVADTEYRNSAVSLDRIHAIQLVSERVTSSSGSGSHRRRSSYYSYEINLVLEDGSRINVVDHGKVDRIRQDARQLAEFLDVPVWDVS